MFLFRIMGRLNCEGLVFGWFVGEGKVRVY